MSYFSNYVKCLQGLIQPLLEVKIHTELPDSRARPYEPEPQDSSAVSRWVVPRGFALDQNSLIHYVETLHGLIWAKVLLHVLLPFQPTSTRSTRHRHQPGAWKWRVTGTPAQPAGSAIPTHRLGRVLSIRSLPFPYNYLDFKYTFQFVFMLGVLFLSC